VQKTADSGFQFPLEHRGRQKAHALAHGDGQKYGAMLLKQQKRSRAGSQGYRGAEEITRRAQHWLTESRGEHQQEANGLTAQ